MISLKFLLLSTDLLYYSTMAPSFIRNNLQPYPRSAEVHPPGWSKEALIALTGLLISVAIPIAAFVLRHMCRPSLPRRTARQPEAASTPQTRNVLLVDLSSYESPFEVSRAETSDWEELWRLQTLHDED